MRNFLLVAVLAMAGPTTAHATEPRGICYQVIEGQPNVAPAAPILVDRCSGKSFVLSRGRSGSRTYEWVAIRKAAESLKATRSAAAGSSSKIEAGDRKGCFKFNGRSFCP